MATSLARQLKKLAVPETTVHDVARRPASFLFDQRSDVGPHLNRETVHAIGLNGLEELQMLLPAFSRFQETLFNLSSISFERSIHSRETNDKVDADISVFLRLLSPFLLLKPAHKALEWLVHRFHVHMYNMNDLLYCALPYHDTTVFVRIIQLIDLTMDRAKSWDWLLQCQKSGYPLSKITLCNRCRSNLPFLKTIGEYAASSSKCTYLREDGLLRTQVLFFMSTTMDVLENVDQVTENLVAMLIPLLKCGLQSGIQEYQAATYIILAQLAQKVVVVQDVWDSFLKTMFSHLPDNMLSEAVTCLAVVCEHQTLSSLPRSCCLQLLKKAGRSCVSQLSHSFKSSALLRLLLKHQIVTVLRNRKIDNSVNCLKEVRKFRFLTQTFQLNYDDISCAVRDLLHFYSGLPKKKRRRANGIKLLKSLENRYYGEFDDLLQSVASKMSSEATTELVDSFLSHLTVDTTTACMFLSLNHPSVSRRQQAVQRIASDTTVDLNNEVNQTNILQRLTDDASSVIGQVLLSKRLVENLPAERLTCALLKIVVQYEGNANWKDVWVMSINQLALVDVSKLSSQTWHNMIVVLLPIVFAQNNLEIVDQLSTLPFFCVVQRDLQLSGDSAKSFRTCLTLSISSALVLLPLEQKLRFVEYFTNDDAHSGMSFDLFRSVALPVVFGKLIAAEADLRGRPVLARAVMAFFGKQFDMKLPRMVDGGVYVDSLNFLECVASYSAVPLACKWSALLWGLNEFICELQLPETMNDVTWFSEVDSEDSVMLAVYVDLFDILTRSYENTAVKEAIKTVLSTWCKRCFTSGEQFLNFLLYLLTPIVNTTKRVLAQFRALHMLAATEKILGKVENPSSLTKFLPALLIAATSPIVHIRSASLVCLEKFCLTFNRDTVIHGALNSIVSHRLEIQVDGSLLQFVLKHYFTSENPSAKKDLHQFLGWFGERKPHHILLGLLSCLDGMNHPDILHKLIPLLDGIVEATECSTTAHRLAMKVISKFEPDAAGAFSTHASDFAILLKVLCCNRPPPPCPQLPTLQMATLAQLTPAFFASLENSKLQQEVLKNLVDLQLDNDDYKAMHQLAVTLRELLLDGEQIKCELLKSLNSKVHPELLKDRKRIRKSTEQFLHQRTVVILESIQGKRQFRRVDRLVPTLLKVLEKFLEKSDLPMVEYAKQLVLSALHSCFELIDSERSGGLAQDRFNIEAVIHCIRTSTSLKTRQEALMLLTLSARLYPEHVVHNAMAIFTFMGENVVRQDDSTTFELIEQTVAAIVPAALETNQLSNEEAACSYTRIFVDALPDIPEHRRLSLFTSLVTALGDQRFLWVAVALVIEKLVTLRKSSDQQETFKRSGVLSFLVKLCNRYSALCQVQSCSELLAYAVHLEDDDDDDGDTSRRASRRARPESLGTLVDAMDLKRHGPKLCSHFKILTAEFESMLLSDQDFLYQIVDVDKDAMEKIMVSYRHILESIFTSATDVARAMEANASSQLVKYWKVLQHRTYELLDKLTSLLPGNQFIAVIDEMIKDCKMTLRRKALDILVAKIQQSGHEFDESESDVLCSMVPTLLAIAESNRSTESAEELATNKQMALLALKLLCQILAVRHPSTFEKVFEHTISIAGDGTLNDNVRASALLYVAEHSATIKLHVIANIARLVPTLFVVLDDLDKVSKSELLLLSVVMALQKVVAKVPQFLNPYLEVILEKVCRLSTLSPENPKSPLVLRLANIRTNIATTISPRVTLPIIQQCFASLSSDFPAAIKSLMSVVEEVIVHGDKDDLSLRQGQLTTFLVTALDFRQEHPDDACTDEIEGCILKSMSAMVLKMSEATFRPFFRKLLNWATSDESARDRLLTFYRATDTFAEQLKSLFALFAEQIVKHAAELLDQNNPSKSDAATFFGGKSGATKALTLVRYILDCLRKTFLYDNENFVTRERFDVLFQPIVDHIENVSDEYNDFVTSHLAPCVAQLATAVSSQVLWKPLNRHVLLKCRHRSPQVRLGALQVLRQLAKSIGTDYNVVIPETITYMAELMEDEDVEVERLSRAVLTEMEEMLGEKLQDYM